MASRLALRIRIAIALVAVALPPLTLTVLAVGGYLFHKRLLGLEAGALWLTVACAMGLFGLVILIAGRCAGWVSWRWLLLLTLPCLAPPAAALAAADWVKRHPSLADVTTDFVDPPVFAVPVPYNAADKASQRRIAPLVESLTVKVPPEQAYALALKAVQARGWAVTASSAADGGIEGHAGLGRYQDRRDWVIRIRPELAGGALVDMRLRSRTDMPDFGGNGAVVQALLADIRTRAEQARAPKQALP